MRKIRAPGFKILVRVKKVEKPKEEMSEGGIFLHVNSEHELELEQQGMAEGHVVDIGPFAFRIQGDHSPWCTIGDCVEFYAHAGKLMKDIDEDGYSYRMINDLDIQAIFPDEAIEL